MELAQITDVGLKRQSNQDQVGIFANQTGQKLLLLCDGMGGHNAGDVASEMALFQVGHQWEEEESIQSQDQIKTWLDTAIKEANHRVREKAQQFMGLEGMGTTLIALTIYQGQAIIAHVGDSRVYRFNQDKIAQVTKDHSFVQELVDNAVISEEEAATHPQRNIVTRAIGTEADLTVDVQVLDLVADDILLLCSDGLSDMLTQAQVIEILSQDTSIDQAAQALVESANASGGKDNISVILARIEGGDMPWNQDKL